MPCPNTTVVKEANVRVAAAAVIVIPFMVLFVSDSVPAKVARVPVVGNVTLVVAVAVRVVEKAPAVASVEPVIKVRVALVVGDVIVTLFMLVAVAAPNTGVTSVGVLANTTAPEPVSSVIAAARLAEVGVPKKVAIPVPKEVIPVPPLATDKVPDVNIPVEPDCTAPVPRLPKRTWPAPTQRAYELVIVALVPAVGALATYKVAASVIVDAPTKL